MKANALIGIALVALVGWGAATEAQAYRWVDEKGRVHYTNIPPSRPAPPEPAAPAQPSEPGAPQGPQPAKGPEPRTSSPEFQARPGQRVPIEGILGTTGAQKQERRSGLPMSALFLMAVSVILFLGGNVWLIVVGFKQSVLWGVLMLLFSPCQAFFLCYHWQEAKRPFLVEMAGGAVGLASLLMVLAAGPPG